MEEGTNVRIGISHGSMFLKIIIAQFLIRVGLNMVRLLIALALHKFEFVDNFITYTGIFNQIISLILAIKFVCKKYVVKENVDDFVNKLITLLIILWSVCTILEVYNGYKQTLTKIIICDAVKSAYEDALESNLELEPYKENCKTIQDSIDEVEKDKEWHIFNQLVEPVIENNLILVGHFIILAFYAKKKISV